MSTHGYGARRRASKLRDAPVDPQESANKLEQAIYWSGRIRRGEDLHLTDLCISTVQRHVTTLIRHVEPEGRPADSLDGPAVAHDSRASVRGRRPLDLFEQGFRVQRFGRLGPLGGACRLGGVGRLGGF